MAVICALLATALLAGWVYLAVSVTKDDIVDIMIAKRKNAAAKLKRLAREERISIARLINDGEEELGRAVKNKRKKFAKKRAEAEKSLAKIEKGQPDIFDIMPACGYALLRRASVDLDAKLFRGLIQSYSRVDGKEGAAVKSKYLVASTAAYAIIGLMIDFTAVSLCVSGENDSAGILGIIILLFTVVLCYVPLSNLRQQAQYREERIEAEFPNVVSKLAMLINSGMEVSRAWELTAYSGSDVLYDEMRVVVELQNSNVSPMSAYTQFMNNCNNKYTSKLATSIMQNLSKGNAEIGALFIQFSAESWMERKHSAKRLGEKAQGNLLVPTIMIFAGIMVMIMVPLVYSMASAV